MQTYIYDLTDKNIYEEAIRKAALAINNSGTVVFPTETVYGIGANAYDEAAIRKLFAAKNRPLDNPLIVHLASPEDIHSVARGIPKEAEKAAEAFMPGPITLIVPKGSNISPMVTAGLDTGAVRVPRRRSARDFIAACGVPIVAPSANVSGKPSTTSPKHVLDDMYGKVDVILTEGDCEVGLESTVVDFTCMPARILRPGGVTPEALSKVVALDMNYLPKTLADDGGVPKSPGMKYRHYKPDAHVVLLLGDESQIVRYINARAKSCGEKCAAAVFKHLTAKSHAARFFRWETRQSRKKRLHGCLNA